MGGRRVVITGGQSHAGALLRDKESTMCERWKYTIGMCDGKSKYGVFQQASGADTVWHDRTTFCLENYTTTRNCYALRSHQLLGWY